MNCTRTGIAAVGTAGLLLASLALAAPAQAHASAPVATSAAAENSGPVSGTIQNKTATVRVSVADGTRVILKAGKRQVAGTTAIGGVATMVFMAPSTTTTFEAYTVQGAAETSVGTVDLGAGVLTAPTVDYINATGSAVAGFISGKPGAVVSVKNGDRVIAVKSLSSKGATQLTLPVAKDATTDTALTFTQTDGSTDSQTATGYVLAAPTVSVVKAYAGGAIVRVKSPDSGTVEVRDADGKRVFKVSGQGAFTREGQVKVSEGTTSTFSVSRVRDQYSSKKVDLDVTGTSAALPAPKAEYVKPSLAGLKPFLRYTTEPFASIFYVDDKGIVTRPFTADADGVAIDRNLAPGSTLTVVAAIGYDFRSAPLVVDVPGE